MLAQQQALKNERESREAQNSLLRLRERTTQQLEKQVKERTQKLESAMHNLTALNHKLDNLSSLDSLTGLFNRRYFDKEFESTWHISLRDKKPITILMTDIDFFKNINDTYGHLFGDECLIKVAKVLRKCVSSPESLTARFG